MSPNFHNILVTLQMPKNGWCKLVARTPLPHSKTEDSLSQVALLSRQCNVQCEMINEWELDCCCCWCCWGCCVVAVVAFVAVVFLGTTVCKAIVKGSAINLIYFSKDTNQISC